MHRLVAGTCRMELTLTPLSPWMVRGLDPTGKGDFEPILDRTGNPFIPASSLKGALRSTAERVLRSMHPERSVDLAPLADDPFVPKRDTTVLTGKPRGEIADSELIEWYQANPTKAAHGAIDHLYQHLAAISQLFGATVHAGLVTLEDAIAHVSLPPESWQRRPHVAIDRFTGGVGVGPFSTTAAPAKAQGQPVHLTSTLTIRNFTLWQLGLLAITFQEFGLGYAAMGAGTRKGYGRFTVAVPQIECAYHAGLLQHVGITSAEAALPLYSAQGLLAASSTAAPTAAHDVPPEIRLLEVQAGHPRALSPGHLQRTAQPPTSWRTTGTVIGTATGATVTELFQAAVVGPWRTWVRYKQEEQA